MLQDFTVVFVIRSNMKATFGANRLNSETQLGRVESGAATRYGPLTPISTRCAIRPIH